MAPQALYGLAGEVVNTLAPETESDPVAILGQFLVGFGSAVGSGPHFQVEGDAHRANLFMCLVGESSRGRKGTSRGRIMQLLTHADENWCSNCVASGLSSGEGLIWCVRDPIIKQEAVKERGRVVAYQDVIVDPGVSDKRLLVNASEFVHCLRVMQRPGNSLSPTIREAWDSGNLRTLSKNRPARATGAHISIAAQITKPELGKNMKDTDALNGFANRFIWLCVRRSKMLPDGGSVLDLSPLGARLKQTLAAARKVGPMVRSAGASTLWRTIYPELTAERAGLYGGVTARAEAQVLRLSMIYALLDGSETIDEGHLLAARAFWDYADGSAKLIFDVEPEDPVIHLVQAKLAAAPEGLTRTELHDAFGRNIPAAKLSEALSELQERGLVFGEKERNGKPGAPSERWRAVRTNELIPTEDCSGNGQHRLAPSREVQP